VSKTPAQSAATSILVATSPQLEGIGGRYAGHSDEAAVVDSSASDVGGSGVAAHALDAGDSERGWDVSLCMLQTGTVRRAGPGRARRVAALVGVPRGPNHYGYTLNQSRLRGSFVITPTNLCGS
jgi:hypothetical protein